MAIDDKVKATVQFQETWSGPVYECSKCNITEIWWDYKYCPQCGSQVTEFDHGKYVPNKLVSQVEVTE